MTIRRPQAKGGKKKPLFIPNHKKAFFLTSGAGRRSGDRKRTPATRDEDEERRRGEGDGAEQPKVKRQRNVGCVVAENKNVRRSRSYSALVSGRIAPAQLTNGGGCCAGEENGGGVYGAVMNEPA